MKREWKAADLNELRLELRRFAAAREWDQFHSPKNLAMALSVEVAELLEHFQWLTQDESHALPESTRSDVAEELADVMIYLVRLSGKLHIDLAAEVARKLDKNAAKYPADKVRGSAAKYTAYTSAVDE